MSLPLGYVWHADGDLCLGPECQNIDEATGDHSTDVHSDDWWEGFEEAGRRVALSSPETTPAGVDWDRVAAALSSPETTPAPDAGLDVERLRRAMLNVDEADPGIFNIVAISDPDTRPVAAALAAEYDRLAGWEPE